MITPAVVKTMLVTVLMVMFSLTIIWENNGVSTGAAEAIIEPAVTPRYFTAPSTPRNPRIMPKKPPIPSPARFVLLVFLNVLIMMGLRNSSKKRFLNNTRSIIGTFSEAGFISIIAIPHANAVKIPSRTPFLASSNPPNEKYM